jgi:cob(I)alamin adenosyltransferase
MAELATTPDAAGRLPISGISADDVAALEQVAEELKPEAQIGHRFIIPGESVPGATLDLARAVARRAERHVARMAHAGEVANPEVLRYLNRLSDTLFILARYLERGHAREVS